MIDGPEEIVIRAFCKEMERVRGRVPDGRWFLFGSITTTKRPVGDLDFLVVCKTTSDCVTVRAELASMCARFPVHLLIMTQSEEAEVKFIKEQRAVEITSRKVVLD